MNDDTKQQSRETHILDTAATLIAHHGFDKTTVGDIAHAAGVSRGILYLHFANKEALVEALIRREILLYTRVWLAEQEDDPNSGTLAAMYRHALFAINSRPLMAAFMRRDRRIFGAYLRRPNNIFQAHQSKSQWTETLRQLQHAGAVRQDIAPEVLAAILDMLAYGLLSIDEIRAPDEIPGFDAMMEAIALLLDQALMPEGGSARAGKAIIRNFATAALAQFEQASGAPDAAAFPEQEKARKLP